MASSPNNAGTHMLRFASARVLSADHGRGGALPKRSSWPDRLSSAIISGLISSMTNSSKSAAS
jgi:hypothetical protein